MTKTDTKRTFARRWTEFWFTPGDPTTLGFIRIVTGLLIVYIHLAYSLDLQAFFGKNGWYGAAEIERERHEYPWLVGSLSPNWDTDWDTAFIQPKVPEFPHRRQAVMRFIRGLPAASADRKRAVQFLERICQEDDQTALVVLNFLNTFLLNGRSQDEKVYAALADGRQLYGVAQDGSIFYLDNPTESRGSVTLIPNFLRGLPAEDRKSAVADLRALIAVLPNDPTDAKYVILHIVELNRFQRLALIQFITSLPDNEAERKQLTDYLEYWNSDPRKLYRKGHPLVSVWFHVSDPTQMAVLHGLSLVVMVLFTVGFCTRVTAVLTWVAVVGYVHRTNQILFGMDTMMNILLVYLVIGNSGAALSVDRLIARYRAVRASLRRSGTIDDATRAFLAQAPPSVGAAFGIRLIQVHFCFIYMAAGLSKLKGEAWWSGFAFWDVMMNPEFTLLRYPWFEDMLRWVASIKPLYYFTIAIGVWFTWGLEIAFPFFVWTRARPVMLWMAVLLHASIGVLMGLNIFELLMMTMLLVYLPPGVIRDRLRGGPDLPRLRYAFEAADPDQARAAAIVAALDIDAQVAIDLKKGTAQPSVTVLPEPATTEVRLARGVGSPGLVVAAPLEATTTGPAAVATLFRNLRLLRVLRLALVLPGATHLLARWASPPRPADSQPPTGGPKTGPPSPAAAS
jgi:hypothetical protein